MERISEYIIFCLIINLATLLQIFKCFLECLVHRWGTTNPYISRNFASFRADLLELFLYRLGCPSLRLALLLALIITFLRFDRLNRFERFRIFSNYIITELVTISSVQGCKKLVSDCLLSILTDIHPEKEAFLELDGVELFKVERLSGDEADQVHEGQDTSASAESDVEIRCVDA